MYKQTTLPSSFSFRTSFFVGLFGLFLVSSTVLFAQENSTHESEEVIHKRGERAQWLQPGKRAMQNRARMQHLERNRKDDCESHYKNARN